MSNLQQDNMGFTDIAFNRGMNPGDEHLAVRFEYVSKQNMGKSELEGRPIFEDKEYIEIKTPGSKSNIYFQPANALHKQRFPEHYRLFKARMEQNAVEGVPLVEWPGCTRPQADELRYFNVLTVEQLANLADSNASGIMHIQALKAKAKKYIEASKETAATAKLDKANDEIAELRAMIMEMKEDVPRGTSKKRKKRRTPAEMAAARAEEPVTE